MKKILFQYTLLSGGLFHASLSSADFLQNQLFQIKIFWNTSYQSVKQFGCRSASELCRSASELCWSLTVQTVCKGYQQMTKVSTSKERVKYCIGHSNVFTAGACTHKNGIVTTYENNSGDIKIPLVHS